MFLTTSQINAVNTIDSNLQIVACAGSGKTTTMVARILNLLKQPNVKPENIVAVTYSKKAAASLKQKIYKEFEKENKSLEGLANMYIGTIHGYCYYLLQNYNDDYKNYELLEEVQTRLFMKRFRNEIGIYDVQYHRKKGEPYSLAYPTMSNSKLQEAISAYKTFLDIAREYGVEKLDTTLQLHIKKYEQCLDSKNKFDYTSIIIKTLNLLETGYFDNYITSTVQHLIVDEYQDVNDAQERIINYFYNKGTQICVVGDDDQTIYHWRGINLTYIKDFQTRYRNVSREDLDINFRSSCGITDIARQVIINNQNRLDKQMNSNNTQKYDIGDIIAYDFDDRASEIDFIVKKIKQLYGIEYTKDGKTFGLDYDDMVILVSSVKKIPELIQALQDNKIDFIVEGTQKLFEADEIQIICNTFNLVFDLISGGIEKPFNRSGLQIDKELIRRWKLYSPLNDVDIEQAIIEFVAFVNEADPYEYTIQQNLKNLFANLQLIGQQDEKVLYNWGKFTEIINDFEKIYLDMAPAYKLRAFQTFLRDDAPTIYPEGWLSPNFKTIRSLRIMTYHQSKGLEFPVVFLPFLTQNANFPPRKPGGTSAWGIFNNKAIQNAYENDTESFRRLFYVGITRSEKFLFMTRSPQLFGRGNMYKKPAQPFVEAKNSQYAYQDLCLSKIYPTSQNKKFSEDEVITLNFSLLKDLFDCPFKFEMLNVFGFHSPLNIRMGYGRSVHNMLDYVHKNYKDIKNFDDNTIQKIVDKYLYLPYGSKLLVEAMKTKTFQHLRSYIINNQANFQNIIFSEKTIDYSINEYLFIDGRIDLVKDSLNNTITIVDFKSSSEALSKEQIKNQLMVYVLGYESMTGDNVDFIESYDFNDNNPTRIHIVQEDKDIFRKKLKECHRIIHSGAYDKITNIDSSKGKKYCQELKCEFIKNCFPK